MVKIKTPSVAGMFYPANKEELEKLIEKYDASLDKTPTRAVIVPHAGYVYSGKLAYSGIYKLSRDIQNIFIIAPSHRNYFQGISSVDYDVFQTPLGNIEVNVDIVNELKENNFVVIDNDNYIDEHSLEVQIPLIQSIFDNVKIIPLLVGDVNYNEISKIIEKYYFDAKNGFVISSDLSHFLEDKKAKEVDLKTAYLIENNDLNLTGANACGYKGIQALIDFANKNNYSFIRIGMYNSSFSTNDKSRVVGYGSWLLYEGDKNEYIEKNCSEFLINLSKTVLKLQFSPSETRLSYPQVLNELGASFVTLEKNGNLRGCIGSIIAHKPLITDIIENTKKSAFSDPRFEPLKESELDEIKISISVLSPFKEIFFENEQDLLNKIVPYKDGIIIKDGSYQAVYLPSVWEQIPDKELFLKSLKIKAGLSPEHFSKDFKAYRFTTVYIKEK